MHASATENADLFWGLRGGGGNFGVVTSFEYKLHPVSTVFGGMLVYPLARAREVLRLYRDVTQSAPDELTVFAGLMYSPDGVPIVALVDLLQWAGGGRREGDCRVQGVRADRGRSRTDAVHGASNDARRRLPARSAGSLAIRVRDVDPGRSRRGGCLGVREGSVAAQRAHASSSSAAP